MATESRTVDVLVVGAGTGMFAAIAAAEAGLSVLLAEKREFLGGSTALSGGGIWVPNNSVLAEHGVPDSAERAEAYVAGLVGPLGELAPAERWRSYLEHGPDAIDLLRRCSPGGYAPMPDYPDYFPEADGGSPRGRSIEPRPVDAAQLGPDQDLLRPTGLKAPVPMPVTGVDFRWLNLMTRNPRGILRAARRLAQGVGGKLLGRELVAGGQALAVNLMAGLRASGVEVMIESPLRELIIEDGRVVGALLGRPDGGEVIVRVTRAVVLASGGFDHDEELRHAYQSELIESEWSFGAESNTGDVVKIAADAGADLTLMDQAWWFPALAPTPETPPYPLLSDRSLPGSIMVDQAGKRFMNESINYMSAGQIIFGQDDGEAPHHPLWMIFDQRYRNRYLLATQVFPRQDLPKAWYRHGIAHRAASLDELAAQLGLPELPATVARFNLMAAQGKDDDFARGESMYDHYYADPTVFPNPNLAPIDKGPYYAVAVAPGDLGTCGGVRADEFGRALRPSSEPIEGLYAIGNAAGNVFGTIYPGAGCTIGQGLVYGWIVAQHVAGRLGVEGSEG